MKLKLSVPTQEVGFEHKVTILETLIETEVEGAMISNKSNKVLVEVKVGEFRFKGDARYCPNTSKLVFLINRTPITLEGVTYKEV